MAEIAETRQAGPSRTEDRGRHPDVEAGRREAVRAIGDEELDDERTAQGERGGDEQGGAPGELGQAPHEVRRRRSDGQGADENPDREPAAFAEPGRHDLHRGRIGAGQKHPGREPEHQRRPEARGPEGERRVGRHAQRDADGHDQARRENVREVGERAGERADDEAGLDGDRQAGAAAVAQGPLVLESRQDRGGAEPEREGEQLGEGEERELAPGPRHAVATRRFPSV